MLSLLQGLRRNRCLWSCGLSENKFDVRCAKELAHVLQEHPNLAKLSLSGEKECCKLNSCFFQPLLIFVAPPVRILQLSTLMFT